MLFWESCLSSFWHYDKSRNAECKSKCIDIKWNFWWWKRDNFVLPAEFLHLFNAGILASFISFHWSDICTMFCVSFYPIICPKKKYVHSEKQVTAFVAKNRIWEIFRLPSFVRISQQLWTSRNPDLLSHLPLVRLSVLLRPPASSIRARTEGPVDQSRWHTTSNAPAHQDSLGGNVRSVSMPAFFRWSKCCWEDGSRKVE